MENFSKLSEEMVVRILSRLPPKSLIRFRCVRKLWYNVINSPNFVAKNLTTSKHNKFSSSTCILAKHTVLKDSNIKDRNEILEVLRDNSIETKKILLSLCNLCNDNDGDDPNLNYVVDDFTVPLPLGLLPFSLEIAGHCDGIICLNNSFLDDIVLCNPATKESKLLPKSCLLLPPRHPNDYDEIESDVNAVGFGYDSKAQEYKVVRIVSFITGVHKPLPSKAEVYTIGTNSWREIKDQTESHVFWAASFKLFLKGFYFWWASICPPEQEIILSFDMNEELFHDIYIPESVRHDIVRCNRGLAVWKESIALLAYGGDSGAQSFDIWVIDDFGVFKSSWIKYLTIGPLEGISIPLIFWKSNEFLMAATDGRLVSYNLSTQMFKYLPIHGVEDPPYIQAVVYVNSIVSVHASNKLEGINNSS
ncbi:putative F-box domain, leucine-rich repeat domain, L domain-containing protein [Rosa chinensis]|uniref:Putative F-box domain, leucine-rich repeat domain, L domain-containing protein n=1 Tax=Rosa chinensis TaxID=74649 RepID=A0A2P6R7C8_ROSCH|nr:F-box/kelch-repeat protein At3g06240 [Rosa chinensis]PRQ42309.1 putative F-box domain, leucine-rich repeat domain, L domain-containing protein [Rosa chinensis]